MLGHEISIEAEHVIDNQHLSAAVGPGADADGGYSELAGDEFGQLARYKLQDDGEGAGLFQRQGIVDKPPAVSWVLPCTLNPPN
jgi:hypothetical protein